jgi:archaellum biogenesis ATPase FlaH
MLEKWTEVSQLGKEYQPDEDEMESILMRYFVGHRVYFYRLEKYMVVTDREAAKGKRNFFNDSKKQWTINYMSYFNALHGKFPKKEEVFSSAMKKAGDDEAERVAYAALLNAMYGEPINEDSEYIEQEGIYKVLRYTSIKCFHDGKTLVDTNQYVELSTTMLDPLAEIIRSLMHTDDNLRSISAAETAMHIYERFEGKRKQKKISSGYADLDKALNGGWKQEKMYVIAGVSGGGKSIMLLQFALNAAMAGKNVLYVSLEMDDTTIQDRIDVNLLGDHVTSVADMELQYSLDPERIVNEIYDKRMDMQGSIIVMYENELGSTADSYKKILKRANFDLMVVDYIGIMDTADGSNSENPHFKYKQIAEELRSLAKVFKLPVITANQLNADGYKKAVLDLTNLAYSNGIGYTMDFVAAISPDGDELQILKNRDGSAAPLRLAMNKPKYRVLELVYGDLLDSATTEETK